MADIEPIGLSIQTDGIERGIKKLDELATRGPKVEQAMNGIAEGGKRVAKSLADLGGGAGDGLKKTGEAAQQAASGIKASGEAARSTASGNEALKRSIDAITQQSQAYVRSLASQSTAMLTARTDMTGFSAGLSSAQKTLRDMQVQADLSAKAMAQVTASLQSALPAIKATAKAQEDAAKSAASITAALSGAGSTLDRYASGLSKAATSTQATERSFNAMTIASNALAASLAIAGIGFGGREILAQIDGYSKLTAQLKLATRGAADYESAMSAVKRISTDAQQGIGELGTLYARIANGTAELHLSQTKLADITETVALSLKVSNATASEASSAMLQLSQAFASGVLRGEEFNAVNEAAPRLMKALADGMGVPAAALRKMAEAGQLTSTVLADALPKALIRLREEAESVQTISGSFTVLKNNIMLMVGAQSTASGITKTFASGISLLANNLDVLATVGGAAALVLGARFTSSLVATGIAFAASTMQAVRYQSALASMAGVSATAAAGMIAMGGAARGASAAMAFIGGPIGAVLTVAGGAAAAFYAFRDSSESLIQSIGGLHQPLDELKKKIDALPPEKQIVIKMAIQDEQKSAIKQSQKELDELINSVAGMANIRMPDWQFDALINELREAGKEGGNLAPVLERAAAAGNISPHILQKWLEMAGRLRDAQAAAKGAADALGGAASATSVPLVSAENNVLFQRARASLEATKGMKSQAERMAEVRAEARRLTGDLKALQDAQLGGSKEAQQLADRLVGVNEQLKTMEKRGQDKSAAAAIKQEQSEYEKLISSIKLKILENDEELKYGHKLTEAEKLRFMISEDGTKKLTAAHKAEAEAALKRLAAGDLELKQKKDQAAAIETYRKYIDSLDKTAVSIEEMADKQDAANASFGKSKVAIAELAMEQAKLAASNAKDAGPWTQEQLDKLTKIVSAHEHYVQSLKEEIYIQASRKSDDELRDAKSLLELQQYSASLLGVEEVTRNKLIAQRKAEIKLAKELAEIDKAKFSDNPVQNWIRQEEEKKKVRLKYETETQAELGQIQDQYVQQQVQQYDQVFRQGFADMLNNGKDGWKSFTKSLVTTFKTTVADQIYKMFAQPFVVKIVASLLGITGGIAGAAGQAASGGAGVLSTASSIGSGYSMLAGLGTFGGGLSAGFGGLLGSLGLSATGTTLGGSLSAGITALGAGNIAGGIGTLIGALGPIALGLGALIAILGKDDSGTPHSGSVGSFNRETGYRQVQNGTELGDAGIDMGMIYGGPERAKISETVAMGVVGVLDGLELAFGGKGGYTATTGFADDASDDGAWGGLRVIGKDGKDLVNWDEGKGKWAPREFSSGEDGLKEYLNAVAVDTRKVMMESMDLPTWAKDIVGSIKEEDFNLDALQTVVTQIGQIQAVFDGLADTLVGFSNMSSEAMGKMAAASGGVEKLSANASSFYQNFYSDEERIAKQRDAINKSLTGLGLDELNLGTADAREQFRALVEEQLALGDSSAETVAALLALSEAVAGVTTSATDAAAAAKAEADAKAEAAEAQKQAALAATGLTVDSLTSGFITEINEGRGAQAGAWLAETIAAGFEQAIYTHFIDIIMNSMIDGVITPVVTAATTGSAVSAAVSGAAIETMVANARAAAEALATLLNDPAFKEALGEVLGIVKDLGNEIGASIPKMTTYKPAVTNVGNAYSYATSAAESAADAAKKLADQWKSTIDSMTDEMKRLRGELLGGTDDQGMAYYESLYAIKTAQARAGDQDAANELPSIIQALEELAKGTAGTKAEVLLMQSAWLDSLTTTRDFLANKYGVDIGNEQTSVSGATTAAAVIKGSANTAVLGALQSSSDQPALLAEVRALREEVKALREDNRTGTSAMLTPLQGMDRNVARLTKLKEMESM